MNESTYIYIYISHKDPSLHLTPNAQAIGAEVTSCATDMVIKLQDLLKLSVTFDNIDPGNAIGTQVG